MIGDQTVSSSLYVPTISQGQASWLDPSGNKIIYAGTPAAVDPRITWQDIATLDFGFDARFFNGELGGNIRLVSTRHQEHDCSG